MPRQSRRRFCSPSTTRIGEGHRPPIGPGARWRHRAAINKTHWARLSEPSWEREVDLQFSRTHISRYWAGTPDQHRQTNRLYRRMRIGAAERELSRNNGDRFLAPGYACVPRADCLYRCRHTVLPKGAHVWYKGDDGLWCLGKISTSTTRMEYTWSDFWTTRCRSSFLFPRRATRPQRGPYEVRRASRSTKPARSLGGSDLT